MTPRQDRAAEILRRLEGIENPRVAEIGVLNGLLSQMLLSARRDLKLVMVDNWLPADEQPPEYAATGDVSAVSERPELVEAAARAVARKFPCRSKIFKGDSATIAVPGSFDLVFIDGDHSERGVARDIAAWSGRVKLNGWIGGHDYGNPSGKYDFSGVKRAVDAVFLNVETGANYTWWQRL